MNDDQEPTVPETSGKEFDPFVKLRQGGFSEFQIQAWKNDADQRLKAAGFQDEERNDLWKLYQVQPPKPPAQPPRPSSAYFTRALTGVAEERDVTDPFGVQQRIRTGGAPQGEDFQNAASVIAQGNEPIAMTVEEKLRKLYDSRGLHPAEVATDAQENLRLMQSLVSKGADEAEHYDVRPGWGMLSKAEQQVEVNKRIAAGRVVAEKTIPMLERALAAAKSGHIPADVIAEMRASPYGASTGMMMVPSLEGALAAAKRKVSEAEAFQNGSHAPITQTVWRSTPRALAAGALNTVMALPEGVGIAYGWLKHWAVGTEIDDESIQSWIRSAKDWAAEMFPADVGRQNDILEHTASTLGMLGGLYGAGGVAKLARAGPRGVAWAIGAAGAIGQGVMGHEEGVAAMKAPQTITEPTGAPELAGAGASIATGEPQTSRPVTTTDVLAGTIGQTAIGTAMAIPFGRMATKGLSHDTRLGRALIGAGEQAALFPAFGVAGNLVSRETYDPNRQLFTDFWQSMGVGVAVGFITGMAAPGMPKPRRALEYTPTEIQGMLAEHPAMAEEYKKFARATIADDFAPQLLPEVRNDLIYVLDQIDPDLANRLHDHQLPGEPRGPLAPVPQAAPHLQELEQRLNSIVQGFVSGVPVRVFEGEARPGEEARFTFGGEAARAAPLSELRKAQRMARLGEDPDAVWEKTGWRKDVEGRWKFEVDDRLAFIDLSDRKVNPDNPNQTGVSGRLGDVLSHTKLFEQYPQLEDIPVTVIIDKSRPKDFREGIHYPAAMGEKIYIKAGSEEAAERTILHEAQHAVQEFEKFNPGSSPEYSKDFSVFRAVMADISQKRGIVPDTPEYERLWKKIAFQIYQRSAGEAEARNVEARQAMTEAERRETPPWLTQDIPDVERIVHDVGDAEYQIINQAIDEAKSNKLYGVHSTTADFDRFDMAYHGTANDAGFYGVGIYMTPIEAIKQQAKEGKAGYFFRVTYEIPESGRNIPLEVDAKNVFEIDQAGGKKARTFEADWDNLKSHGWTAKRPPGWVSQAGYTPKKFTEALIAAGYDAVAVFENGKAKEFVAIKPGTVKSAISKQPMFSFGGKSTERSIGRFESTGRIADDVVSNPDFIVRAYHGTQAEFEKFDPQSARQQHERSAVFFALTPKLSNVWASFPSGGRSLVTNVRLGKSRVIDVAHEIYENEEFISEMREAFKQNLRNRGFSEEDISGRGMNSYELNQRNIINALQQSMADSKVDPEIIPSVPANGLITGAVIRIAQKEGLDTVILRNMREGRGVKATPDQLIALRPGTVESAYGKKSMYSFGEEEPVIQGYFDPKAQTIWVSAAALDPELVVREEAAHAIKALGLYTPDEWAQLTVEARDNGWIDAIPNRELYEQKYGHLGPDLLADALADEAVAKAFAGWRKGEVEVKGWVSQLFQRLASLLDRMGNWLRGQGFNTADDVGRLYGYQSAEQVFRAIETGEIKRRQDELALREDSEISREFRRAAGAGAPPAIPPTGAPPSRGFAPTPPPGGYTPQQIANARATVLSRLSIGDPEQRQRFGAEQFYKHFLDKQYFVGKAVVEATGQRASGQEGLPTEANPYHLIRMAPGIAGKIDHFIMDGSFDFNTHEVNGEGLKPILDLIRGSAVDFSAFLASVRNMELAARDIATGIDVGASRIYGQSQIDRFAEPATRLYAWKDKTLAYLRDSGVISAESYDRIKEANKFHVAFHRVFNPEEQRMMISSVAQGGGVQPRNPVHVIKGSERIIIDPLESAIKDAAIFIKQAENNAITRALVDMLMGFHAEAEAAATEVRAERVGEPAGTTEQQPIDVEATVPVAEGLPGAQKKIGETRAGLPAPVERLSSDIAPGARAAAEEFLRNNGVDGAPPELVDWVAAEAAGPPPAGQVAVYREGRREIYRVDPELAEAIKGLNRESLGLIEKMMAIPAGTLRAGAVLTPQFGLRHIFRSFEYAFITGKGFFSPVDTAKGIAAIFGHSEGYREWLRSGGANVAMVGLDRDYLQERLTDMADYGLFTRTWNLVMDPQRSVFAKAGTVLGLPYQAGQRYLMHPLRVWIEMSENAQHVGAFLKERRRQEQAGETAAIGSKAAIQRAGWESRETGVDIRRMGASMHAFNMITAFSNIILQDTDRVVRAFAANRVSTLFRVGLAITAPSVALWIANHDQKWYQRAEAWEKDIFWMINIGTDDDEHSVVLRFPKPFLAGVLFGTGPERALSAYFDGNKGELEKFIAGLQETAMPRIVPTAASPLLEHWGNRSFFFNQNIVNKSQEKMLPEYQFTEYTTETAKAVARAMSTIPGMREMALGKERSGHFMAQAMTSPAIMENYLRGWTGTLGMWALKSVDQAGFLAGVYDRKLLPAATLADYPVIGSFIHRHPSAKAQNIQDFYDRYEVNEAYLTTWQNLAKAGDAIEAERVRQLGGPATFVRLKEIHDALHNQHQLVGAVIKDKTMQPSDKRQLIDQIYRAMSFTADNGNAIMDAVEAQIRSQKRH